jgi:hypothetical protein
VFIFQEDDIAFKIKNGIDSLDRTNTFLDFLLPIRHNKNVRYLNKQKYKVYKEYMLMIQDIQVVAIFLNNNYEMIQEGLILAKLSPQIKNQVECKIASYLSN